MEKVINFIISGVGITSILIFAFFLTMYIVGYVKSKKNELVVINGKKDFKTLGIIFATPIFTVFFWNSTSGMIIWVGLPVTIVSIIYTIYLSYIANIGHPKKIFISISAKVFVISMMMFIFYITLMEVLLAEDKKNKDRRFKDGTRGNLILAAERRQQRLMERFVKSLIR